MMTIREPGQDREVDDNMLKGSYRRQCIDSAEACRQRAVRDRERGRRLLFLQAIHQCSFHSLRLSLHSLVIPVPACGGSLVWVDIMGRSMRTLTPHTQSRCSPKTDTAEQYSGRKNKVGVSSVRGCQHTRRFSIWSDDRLDIIAWLNYQSSPPQYLEEMSLCSSL